MICLTMIVKDEAHVIARAIQSVRSMIDCFAIVDTGSVDETERVARHALEGLPGRFTYAPWEGYGKARTRSLAVAADVAKEGHALIVDADDVFVGARPELTDADGHAMWVEKPGARWTTTRFLRLGKGIRYVGAVHEMPVYPDGGIVPATILDGLTVTSPQDGATSKRPDKYLEHARLIAAEMVDDPTNTRNAFYLARSYRDHGDDERAAKLFLARAAMGPGQEPEQVYCSFLEAGRSLWRLGRIDDAKRALLNAHACFPARREAMKELAILFATKCATSPTVGTLFVETDYGDEVEP